MAEAVKKLPKLWSFSRVAYIGCHSLQDGLESTCNLTTVPTTIVRRARPLRLVCGWLVVVVVAHLTRCDAGCPPIHLANSPRFVPPPRLTPPTVQYSTRGPRTRRGRGNSLFLREILNIKDITNSNNYVGYEPKGIRMRDIAVYGDGTTTNC
jgi:hypothetical protein